MMNGGRSLADTTPIERLVRPCQEFAKLEASGGILLIGCTVAALMWDDRSGGVLRWNEFYRDASRHPRNLARDSLLVLLKAVLGMRPKSNGPGRNNRSMLQAISEGTKNYEAMRISKILPTANQQVVRCFMQRNHAVVRPTAHDRTASAVAGDDYSSSGNGGTENSKRSTGFTCCADRSLFRSTTGQYSGRFDLSAGSHPDAAVDGAKQEFER